jgi:hypothetical protein
MYLWIVYIPLASHGHVAPPETRRMIHSSLYRPKETTVMQSSPRNEKGQLVYLPEHNAEAEQTQQSEQFLFFKRLRIW